jgi:hypothetical protein
MKTKLLIVIFFTVAFLFPAKSQEHRINEYFDDNTEWIEVKIEEGTDLKGDTMCYRYYIEGDTVIHEIPSKKLFIQHLRYFEGITPPDNAKGLIGSLYSLDKKIYFRLNDKHSGLIIYPFCTNNTASEDDYEDYLLYDFNLVSGDKIPYLCDYDFAEIKSVDFIELDGITLKRFILSDYHGFTIESIGNSNGLFHPIEQQPTSGTSSKIISYMRDGKEMYSVEGYKDFLDNIFTPIKTVENKKLVDISHNPHNESLTVSSQQPVAMVQLYNLQGNLLRKYSGIGQQNVVLQIRSLNAGIYIVKIVMQSGVSVSEKILLTK